MDANLLEYLQQTAAEEELNKKKYQDQLMQSKNTAVDEYINPSRSAADIETTANIQALLGQAAASSNNPMTNMTGLNQIMSNIGKQGQQGATENLVNKIQHKTSLEDVLKQISLKDYLGQMERTVGGQTTEDTLENKIKIAQDMAEQKKQQADKQFFWNLIIGGLAGAGQGMSQGASLSKSLQEKGK